MTQRRIEHFDAASVQAQTQMEIRNGITETRRALEALGGIDILNEMAGITATKVAQTTYTDPSNPAAMYVEKTRSHHGPVGDWVPTMVIKESANGKEKIRWRAVNSKTKKTVGEYRHEIVAATVCGFLAENRGNVKDPRIQRINELCEEESQLVVEIARKKKLLKETPAGNVKRRTVHQNDIELLRSRLKKIRFTLGVK